MEILIVGMDEKTKIELEKYLQFAASKEFFIWHLSCTAAYLVGEYWNFFRIAFTYQMIEMRLHKINCWMDILFLKGKNSIGDMTPDDLVRNKHSIREELSKKDWSFEKHGHWPTHINQLDLLTSGVFATLKGSDFLTFSWYQVIHDLTELSWEFDDLFSRVNFEKQKKAKEKVDDSKSID